MSSLFGKTKRILNPANTVVAALYATVTTLFFIFDASTSFFPTLAAKSAFWTMIFLFNFIIAIILLSLTILENPGWRRLNFTLLLTFYLGASVWWLSLPEVSFHGIPAGKGITFGGLLLLSGALSGLYALIVHVFSWVSLGFRA